MGFFKVKAPVFNGASGQRSGNDMEFCFLQRAVFKSRKKASPSRPLFFITWAMVSSCEPLQPGHSRP
jgi:hypothetical protein